MPIKNKDGSTYVIRGVNPLMIDQDHWSEGWKVHYVETEVIILPDPKRKVYEEMFDVTQIPAIVGVGLVSQTEILYCLPIVTTIEEDPVYGQKKKITTWGDKFNFEAIRVDYTGVTASFFAKLPDDVVEKMMTGSIIYVFKERQWWKINGIEHFQDGINIYCLPSELKPSFF